MDSIENYFQKTKLSSFDYNNCISSLMTKYLYSNPDADTTITPRYEITKSKINFYKKNKENIENYLTKSKSSTKYNLQNLKKNPKLGYDEEKNSTRVKPKNIKYQGPVDSLGLLLRNKIVHDKILLNYQDREVQFFGKKINIIKNFNKFEKYKKRQKVTQIIPTILEKDFFNNKDISSYDGYDFNSNKFNFTKKVLDRLIYMDLSDFIKGSVYLLCDYFRPTKKFPESREDFCMNYDNLTNSIYLFSGNSCKLYSDHIWKFNNNNYTWTNLKSSNYQSDTRRGHTGIIYKNKLYFWWNIFA